MRLVLVIIISSFVSTIGAQQIVLPATYLDQPVLVNPALTGSTPNLTSLYINYRKQWVGLDGGPESGWLGVHGQLTDLHMGLGASFFNDITGPLRTTGLRGNYAYHVQIDEVNNLSLGLSASTFQSKLRFSELDFDLPGDPVEVGADIVAYNFEVDLGIMYHTASSYIGISIPQALQTKTNYIADTLEATYQNVRHYVGMAGHQMELTENVKLWPNTMVSISQGKSPLVDVGCRFVWKDDYWFAGNYFTSGVYGLSAGLRFKEQFKLAYAYQGANSSIMSVSSGNHELGLVYELGE